MTPLRLAMIQAMQQRGFSPRTQQSYLASVSRLAQYFHRSPEQISLQELQPYFNYLAQERNLCGASCRLHLNGIRFFYLKVLHQRSFDVSLILPKRQQRIPELLTQAEVRQICLATLNLKHRTLLLTTYGCGLRVSEVVSLRLACIDAERHALHIHQGKGSKDRLVTVSEGLLEALRRYWRQYRPAGWLFPGQKPGCHLAIDSAQRCFSQAKQRAGVEKEGGIHGLRHAYATHQLHAGMRVDQLQRQLGHQDLHSTLRYVHWVPDHRERQTAGTDLIAALEAPHD